MEIFMDSYPRNQMYEVGEIGRAVSDRTDPSSWERCISCFVELSKRTRTNDRPANWQDPPIKNLIMPAASQALLRGLEERPIVAEQMRLELILVDPGAACG
jgi:hypothetical protein